MPEAFIAALAWTVYSAPALSRKETEKPVGLFFRGDAPASRNVEYRQTAPEGDGAAALARELLASGIVAEGEESVLVEAVLNSVQGLRVERSGMQPASPISPSFALLQNTRGLLRKQNPPALADILESMYSLGSGSRSGERAVALRWKSAANHRLRVDPLVAALDNAINKALIQRVELETNGAPIGSPAEVAMPGTPFEWFASAWVTLTSHEWVEALPARVWVDWATTVLRLAFGAGFLWEASWYLSIAREIVSEKHPRSSQEIRAGIGEVIPWGSSRAGVAARDIAPRISRRVYQAELVRHALDDWNKRNESNLDFENAVRTMRADDSLRRDLLSALGSTERVNSGTNLWEAIKYALMTRDSSGDNPDYYGLLRSHGRFLTVEPGTEWVAVVASLACKKPGGITDVSNVLAVLDQLGTRPELADLVALLEKAGMARGSADADGGVLVESAF